MDNIFVVVVVVAPALYAMSRWKRLPSYNAATRTTAVLLLITSMIFTFWSSRSTQYGASSSSSTEKTTTTVIKSQKKNYGYLELLIRDESSSSSTTSSRKEHFDKFKRGKFMLVNSSSTHPFFICMSPKTGCTALHNFFMYPNFRILIDKASSTNAGFVHATYTKNFSSMFAWNFDSNVFASHAKIVIARNPYVRFLSSYQDWIRRHVLDGEDVGRISFEEFTRMYSNKTLLEKFPKTLMDHIDPITSEWNCNYDGVTGGGRGGFATVLRLEEQALWFDDLLEYFNLTQHMKEYKELGNNTVFESLITPSTSLVVDHVSSITGVSPWPGKIVEISHHKNSANNLYDFYYTKEEVVEIVNKEFYDDFRHFQYPLWDGRNGTFRFV